MTTPHAFALVTGATDGIGKASARQLASAGFYVIIHGRDEMHLRATADDLRRFPNAPQIDWVQADFAELAQVKSLGAYLADNYDRLDVLLNADSRLTVTSARSRSTISRLSH